MAPCTVVRFNPAHRNPGPARTTGTSGKAPRTVDPGRTPDAVRLGLASAALPDPRRALGTLAEVAAAGGGRGVR
jgi:hypothetical protein